jgi:hypothetical protein
MERAQENMLMDAELDAVSGGATIVGISIENQKAIAMQQKLTDIYLANHPVSFQPNLP